MLSIRKDIENIDKGIEEYSTHSYIGFRYRGRYLGSILTQRQSFDLGYAIIDDDGNVVEYSAQRISKPDDGYSNSLEKIKRPLKYQKSLKVNLPF